MNFFRSDDGYSQLTADDCLELFLDILKGSSDITPELLCTLCDSYCMPHAGSLILAAPKLLNAVRSAAATYHDRLLLLEEEREWRPDDEYEDMKGHYQALLNDATAALAIADAEGHASFAN